MARRHGHGPGLPLPPEPAQSQPRGCSTESQPSSHGLASGRAKAWEPATGLGQPLLPCWALAAGTHLFCWLSLTCLTCPVSPPPGSGKGLSQPERPGEGRAEQGQTERWPLGSWGGRAARELVPGTVCPEPQAMSPRQSQAVAWDTGAAPPSVGWGRHVPELPAWSCLPPPCYYRVHGLHPRPSPPLGPGWYPLAPWSHRPWSSTPACGAGILIPGCPQEAREQEQVWSVLCLAWEEGHSDMGPRTRVWGSWPDEGVLVPGCPSQLCPPQALLPPRTLSSGRGVLCMWTPSLLTPSQL